jgi:hypothetical protein
MTRVQMLILAGLLMAVLGVFCVGAVLARSVLLTPPGTEVAEEPPGAQPPIGTATPAPLPSATPAFVFTSTSTPTPNVPRSPTATNTRVVNDTATPTITDTPTVTPIPTETATPTRARQSSGSSGGGGSSSGPKPTPVPTSRFPLKMLEGPVSYKTHNHFLVVLAQVTRGYTYLGGYRLIATKTPSGAIYKGPPSCPYICKANGPEGSILERGNMFLEIPYESGVVSLMIVDPQGQQASEVFQITTNVDLDQWWFYYRFGQ